MAKVMGIDQQRGAPAYTSAAEQEGGRSLGFAAVSAPIDVLVPPLFRRTNAAVRGDGRIAVITYADATALPSLDGSGLRAGESALRMEASMKPHAGPAGDDAAAFGGASSHPLSLHTDDAQRVKQGLLEVLLGVAEGGPGDYGNGRPLPAPPLEDDMDMRLHGTHCDATYIATAPLLLQLVARILKNRTHPDRVMVGCVTSIDLSHTSLGLVGSEGPPSYEDELGSDSAWPADACFYPDQSLPFARCSSKVRARLAARSLSLCYVAPLLFVPAAQNYRIRHLVCAYCQLNDDDAEALAAILSHERSRTHECWLESVDLSFNAITNSGAAALLRGLRKNDTVTSLILVGNTGVTNQKTLDRIEEQLLKVRTKRTAKPWFLRLFR